MSTSSRKTLAALGIVLVAAIVAALLWPAHGPVKSSSGPAPADAPPPVKLSPEEEQRRAEEAKKQLIAAELEKLKKAYAAEEAARAADFQANPKMEKACRAWKFHRAYQGRNSPEYSETLGWWDSNQSAEQRPVLRSVTRKLALQQLLKLREDPETADWFTPFIETQTSEFDLAQRDKWWRDDSTNDSGFAMLPPPAQLAQVIDPAAKSSQYELTDEEKSIFPPTVLQYLEGSAEADVLNASALAYYKRNRSEALKQAEEADQQQLSKYSKLVDPPPHP